MQIFRFSDFDAKEELSMNSQAQEKNTQFNKLLLLQWLLKNTMIVIKIIIINILFL